MTRVSDSVRGLYRAEMNPAATADDLVVRRRHLERAHIVSQPDPWLHTCNHAAMLNLCCANTAAERHSDRCCG